MERTVPKSATDEIDLYLRTIYSLLRSTTEVQIRTLEEVHAGMNSSLHPDARKVTPDTSAFIYASLRLPTCITETRSIVLGQSAQLFSRHGYMDVENWQPVTARARRRSSYFDGTSTLAVFIASRSDIEDIVPTLTAYQIEWNKMHQQLQDWNPSSWEDMSNEASPSFLELSRVLSITTEDLQRLASVWGGEFSATLKKITQQRCSFGIRLLSGSLSEYWRATRMWWHNIERNAPALSDRPVYFVSSNTHSIPNLLSGYALTRKDEILAFLHDQGNQELLAEWQEIQECGNCASTENFLYYALKKFQQTSRGVVEVETMAREEQSHGIIRVPAAHSFDIEAQVVELSRLDPERFDPRLLPDNQKTGFLKKSNALIVNIDYPLGLGAYNVLTKIAEHISEILGVYIMGKAATLNGVRGDIMIPNVVQDEHSQNTYIFQNVFTAPDVIPYLVFGTVLDNQKALTVPGTFLQNANMMDVMYREGYTDIEMEAGPYLSAVYEMTRPKRHPVNEIVNLQGASFDIGILHYASDTPLSKGRNLGAGALSYRGMDSTYASSVAILRRIFQMEERRLG
ncbi:MAG TPA: hypothetical protein PKK59_06365 [Anaerolineaceae bacterium]|nr:hypothetical protein [Anaerolineaceae bacterium]